MIQFDGALGFADRAALLDDLQAHSTDPAFVTDPETLQAWGGAEWEAVLQMRTARDPSTLVVSLSVFQSVNDPTWAPHKAADGKPLTPGPVWPELTGMQRAEGS